MPPPPPPPPSPSALPTPSWLHRDEHFVVTHKTALPRRPLPFPCAVCRPPWSSAPAVLSSTRLNPPSPKLCTSKTPLDPTASGYCPATRAFSQVETGPRHREPEPNIARPPRPLQSHLQSREQRPGRRRGAAAADGERRPDSGAPRAEVGGSLVPVPRLCRFQIARARLILDRPGGCTASSPSQSARARPSGLDL